MLMVSNVENASPKNDIPKYLFEYCQILQWTQFKFSQARGYYNIVIGFRAKIITMRHATYYNIMVPRRLYKFTYKRT